MTPVAVEDTAKRLFEAAQSAISLAAVRDGPEGLSVAEGYAIQTARNALVEASDTPVGIKIGLTSPNAQAMFGAAEPMRGVLYAGTRLRSGELLKVSSLCAPRLEGEIVLRIGSVVDPDVDEATLLSSIASVHAALEVADSRVTDWRIVIGDAIADNACCGRFDMLDAGLAPAEVDLAAVAMSITASDGAVLSTGTGAACLGTPLNAYRWLLEDMAKQGLAPSPGQIVLTGALGPVVPLRSGASYRVCLGGLGCLEIECA